MPNPSPLHISLIAIPEAVISTLLGIFDVLNAFEVLVDFDEAIPETPPFLVEIVSLNDGPVTLAGGMATETHRRIDEIHTTDIIIVPSVLLREGTWRVGRYKNLVTWLHTMHDRGAILCSACSGIFLLAETGLFDDRKATIHWNYLPIFRDIYPKISLYPEQALIVDGDRGQFVSSGASMSWHDLVLYLIAHHVGPTTAQAIAKFFALQWHRNGLGPYIIFEGRSDHGDAAITTAQSWLMDNYSVANPVEEMVRQSGISERTFKRRFKNATGLAPLAYVQQLRVKEAKRRLERTNGSIDEISWRVGYEDPAFFRRLFKRIAGISPSSYRRQFQFTNFSTQEIKHSQMKATPNNLSLSI